MPVFNQSRSRIIRLIFLVTFIIIVAQLFYLQIISRKYRKLANENAIQRTIVYPLRGIIFDRNRRPILNNTLTYDLMVIPSQIKNIDTVFFCNLMDIDTAEFRTRIVNGIIRNRAFRPSVFEASLSAQKFARMQENMWRFGSGFFIQERPIRSYSYDAAANILGYLGEVDSNFLRKHKDEGYQSGDYAGMTGLESSYEKVLMGERGVKFMIKDNFNRIQGSYENGAFDTAAVAGSNLHLSLDIELQKEGEKLMQNKVGAIVAIDPRTGGILAMVSAPTYDPNLLTGAERRKHFSQLYSDPKLPLLNRAVSTYYPPGSTFKTLQAILALHEGVITSKTTFSCSGAFYGCGKPMRCLDPGVFNLTTGITHSCNTYFANVMQRVINNPVYPNIDSSLSSWARYMNGFGLGHKLGVDIPSEKSGYIPTPVTYNRMYGKRHWNFCSFRSVSIGQGEVLTTPIQMANEMAYLANKGWYIIPHLVDSIEGGDKFGLLNKYKKRIDPIDIPDSVFEAVHNGMQGVVDAGTGAGARVPGIVICGKTGTAENYYHGVKQKDHSFFAAFAPRENPKIAIMVMCENAGFGGTWAAPIAGLMIEKYLKDSIAADRKPLEQRMMNANLIPAYMLHEMRTKDSLRQVRKDSLETIRKVLKDTLQTEEVPDEEQAIVTILKKQDDKNKDSAFKKTIHNAEAILPKKKNTGDKKN
ncbi:MAG: penicillin-binding protein 2 [Bacteroidetes bacterium]|nr:penicillin-binding protein 2 [Bacteroidota bacterium]MBS1931638.1 penicillin-binding protein 2 [Bacteroidota bacterium]